MNVESGLRIRHLSPAFRTFCGRGALDALPRELARAGARRAVIIAIPAVAAHEDAMGRLHEALGERLAGQFEGWKSTARCRRSRRPRRSWHITTQML